jgi:hypothetical protein
MTTTTASSTDLRGASTSTYAPTSGRRVTRRTTWVLAGAAAVAITAGSAIVGVQLADADPATGVGVGVTSSAGTDAAGPSHGQGPARASVARDAASIEAGQVAHGTRGSVSDAAGHPLLP